MFEQSDRLILIGAGGHGKVVAETATILGYQEIVFADSAWPDRIANGRWPIVMAQPTIDNPATIFCSVGDNVIRERLFVSFPLHCSPSLLHPAATVSPSVRIGAGVFCQAGAVVNADAVIGKGVILNTGCSVDHDCRIGDFVHISPGAHLAGDVHVGSRTWIGIGASVRQGIRIGSDVVIGAGAAVVSDIADHSRVGGVPAKSI